MKKFFAVAVAAVLVATVAAVALADTYTLGPKDYKPVNLVEAVPGIVTSFSITQQTSITKADLPLLDLFFSDNQMLAWQAKLSEGPITTWAAVDSLTFHAFTKSGEPKKERKLVTKTKRLILQLFFNLKEK